MKLLDKRCSCGFRWDTFHICVDLSEPEPIIATPEPKTERVKRKDTRGSGARRGSDEWKANLAAARRKPRKLAEANMERDKEIVRLYDSGLTIKEVAEEMEIGKGTVQHSLGKASERGDVVIRPKGVRPAPRDEEQEAEILRIYSLGVHMTQIHEIMNIPRHQVEVAMKHAKEEGRVVIRKAGGPRK